MSIAIIGLGSAVPANWLSQTESCNHAKLYSGRQGEQYKLLDQLYRRTTITKRSSVLIEETNNIRANADFFPAPLTANDKGPSTAQRMHTYNLHAANLSALACRSAIRDAGIEINKITHLVTASCTGFSAPGFDLQIIDLLALNRNIYRTHIGFMGCHGAMNALRVAQGYCATNEQATVLVCATEICSLHFQYGNNKNDLIANSLFSDGAAAAILGNASGKIQYSGSASFVIPDSADAITWHIGDNGFVMNLSSHVNDLISEHLPGFLSQWLEKYSLQLMDITAWAVHPGGPRILDTVQKCLSLPISSLNISRQILAEHGNMSSPTVLFILDHLLKSGNTGPGIMLGFGPGLTMEAALFL